MSKPDNRNMPKPANGAPNPEGTDQATKDNDLTTGHRKSGDGGDDNTKK